MNVNSSFVRHIPNRRKLVEACKELKQKQVYVVDIDNYSEFFNKHGPEGIEKANAYVYFALEMYHANVERISWVKEYKHESGDTFRKDVKVFLIDSNISKEAEDDIKLNIPEIKLKTYPVSDFLGINACPQYQKTLF